MKKAIYAMLVLIAALVTYLAFAPVPIAPIAWEAPDNPGYVGAFQANNRLAELQRIDVGKSVGPEDVTAWDGALYATSQTGDITRIDPVTRTVTVIANTGGVPLGIEARDGVLYVADAHLGLLSVTLTGEVRVLTDTVDGSTIDYADDLDIGADGTIYFTDASTKFGAKDHGSTMAASLLEIMESRGTGRVLAYNPRSKQTRLVAEGLVFPNGLALHPDGSLLVNETGRYRVLKINPTTGAMSDWIANMPGFPDNINPGPSTRNGAPTYLLGLISPRSDWLDANAVKPGARKVALRLPPSMRPKAVPYGHIVQLDANGRVLRTFQDPDGAYHDATGAIVHNGVIYVSSLHEDALAFMAYPDLN